MAHKADYLDCCPQPGVVTVKQLYDSYHDMEALCQCQRCSAYWFYRFHEYVDFVGGNDDITVWYTRLTPEEGKQILDAEERPDLAFLSGKPSFMESDGQVQRVQGQPTHPWR